MGTETENNDISPEERASNVCRGILRAIRARQDRHEAEGTGTDSEEENLAGQECGILEIRSYLNESHSLAKSLEIAAAELPNYGHRPASFLEGYKAALAEIEALKN